MTHQEAVKRHAADRYLLGEMAAAERAEFEEHFFECPECAAEVEAGAVFAANAHAVLAEAGLDAGQRAPRRGWWKPGYALALAAVLLLIAGYQELMRIPRLRKELERAMAPQSYPSLFLRPLARGEEQVLVVPEPAPFVGLSLNVPPGSGWKRYVCDIRAGSNQEGVLTVSAPSPASPGAPISVLIPTSRLNPGPYTLVLRGQDGTGIQDLGKFGFTVQIH